MFIDEALCDVRLSLLEGDVEFSVVKSFLERVKTQADRAAREEPGLPSDTARLTPVKGARSGARYQVRSPKSDDRSRIA